MALKDLDNWIIDTKTTSNPKGVQGWQFVELKDHPEYAHLCELALSKTLADKFPRDDRRITFDASNYHTDRMMKETKPKYFSDEDGLISVNVEADAKRILADFQKLDKDVKLSKYGRQFGEAPIPAADVKKK